MDDLPDGGHEIGDPGIGATVPPGIWLAAYCVLFGLALALVAAVGMAIGAPA